MANDGQLKIGTYSPQFEVYLHSKKYGVEKFRDTVLRIDTRGTCRDITGEFRVSFVPKEHYDGETIYDLIEPMDYIEIRLRRFAGPIQMAETGRNDDNGLTVVMRGFVTRIEKQFAIQDGKPQRVIIVSGENYSKLIRMAYIHYAAGLDPAQVVIAAGTSAPLFAGYGIDLVTKLTSPTQAIEETFKKLVKPNFDNIKKLIDVRDNTSRGDGNTQQTITAGHQDDFGDFKTFIDSDGVDGVRLGTSFNIIDPAAGSKEQSVYEFMNMLAGKPWNELYVDDRRDATYLVFRPTPWRDRKGEFLSHIREHESPDALGQGGSRVFVESLDIPNEDIITYSLGRSDAEVFNYYFSDASYSPIGEPYEWIMRARMVTKMGDGAVRNPHYVVGELKWADKTVEGGSRTIPASPKLDYSRIELYGFRKYWNTSKFLAVNPNDLANTNKKDKFDEIYSEVRHDKALKPTSEYTVSMINVGDKLTQILFNANEHNSTLESGNIVIKGNEFVRPGMYVRLKTERQQSDPAWFYVVDVAHMMVPFQSFVTTLVVVRGESYLKKREKF